MAELDVVDQLARYGEALEASVPRVTATDVTTQRPAAVEPLAPRPARRGLVIAAVVAAAAILAVVVGITRSEESSELEVQDPPSTTDRVGLGLDALLSALPAPPGGAVWALTFADLELADELLGVTPPASDDTGALQRYEMQLRGGTGPGEVSPGVGAFIDVVPSETSFVVIDPNVVGAIVSFDTIDLDAPYEESGVGTTLLGRTLAVDAVAAEVARLEPDAEVATEQVDGGTRITATQSGSVELVAHVGESLTILGDDDATVDAVLATMAGEQPALVDDPAVRATIDRLAERRVAAGQISNQTFDAAEFAERRAPLECTGECGPDELAALTEEITARAESQLLPPTLVWAVGGTIGPTRDPGEGFAAYPSNRIGDPSSCPDCTQVAVVLVTFDGPAPEHVPESMAPWFDIPRMPWVQPLLVTVAGGPVAEDLLAIDPGSASWLDLTVRVPVPLPSEGG